MFQFFFAFQVVETFLFYISITYLHQAGFEPAHPEIVGLKSTALDHSAIDAKREKIYMLLAGLEPATSGS
jgi:hypothetical protein